MATKNKKTAGPGDWPDWLKNATAVGAQEMSRGMSNINRGTEPIRYVIDALTRGIQQAAANDRQLLGRISSPDNSVTPPNPYGNVMGSLEGSRRSARTTTSGSQDVDFIRKLLLGLGLK